MPDALPLLEKSPTGIVGFDDITGGGLPRGRPTLICGQAGTGKTLFALQFLLHGIEQAGEPGVFVSFEETPEDLAINIASIGHDLRRHQASGHLRVLHLDVISAEQIEAGEYDLEGLFIQLGAAIDAIAARRVVIDGVENLFAAFDDARTLRREFRRLTQWLKEHRISAIVTTESGPPPLLSRHGIEEYIADCVVTFSHRIHEHTASRLLRVVKYRGSTHGSNEYPFLLGPAGLIVMPLTSAGLDYPASSERISTGITGLDTMLSGGLYRGSNVLVSGTSGTGKSSVAIHMIHAACRRGERCLYVALEESQDQILRNMSSIGIDLADHVAAGLLRFHATRPSSDGLEHHLAMLANLAQTHAPQLVVIDPVTAFHASDDVEPVKSLLVRAGDLLKSRGITAVFTALTPAGDAPESTTVAVSSLVDVWILLRNLEYRGERTRGLYVCKARGIAHSNQIREFALSEDGIQLIDVELDENGEILTGSARLARRLQLDQKARRREAEIAHRRAALETRRQAVAVRIAELQAEIEAEARALEEDIARDGDSTLEQQRMLAMLATRRNQKSTPS